MMKIIQNRKIFYAISAILIAGSIAALSMWGLKLSVDFTGGTLLEISFGENRPSTVEMNEVLAGAQVDYLKEAVVQLSGEKEIIIRLKSLSEEEHQAALALLQDKYGQDKIVENRFESIGPIVGMELKNKAMMAIIAAILGMVAFIAFTFRKVSKPVASWKYGVAAIVALIHDVLITTGVFAVLGHFFGIEVGVLFVTAALTILGYSVNDTIVVYDRIRENLIYRPKDTFAETVNHSIGETFVRSINTSLTVIIVLASLFVFGGETIKYFALALMIGIFFGTYSSIFVASALVVDWHRMGRKI